MHSRVNRRQLITSTVVALAATQSSLLIGQDTTSASGESPSRLKYDSPQVQHWLVGLRLTTPVTCTKVLATFPVPMAWPEQEIEVLQERTVVERISNWKVRPLVGGAQQVVLQIARVPAGTTAELTLTLKVTRSRTLAPERTDDLVIPKKINKRKMGAYIGASEQIDISNPRIKAASRELAARDYDNDWHRVEEIYEYVREKVKYVEGPLKKASLALREGKGDCEEMTSLFIALCRNAKIPARMVWIPDHCYPEFYLEDGDGNGHWFPCQAAGTRQFGRMDEYRPVLQKGDKFSVPGMGRPVRYVAEFFKCDRHGKGSPRPEFIRKQIEL